MVGAVLTIIGSKALTSSFWVITDTVLLAMFLIGLSTESGITGYVGFSGNVSESCNTSEFVPATLKFTKKGYFCPCTRLS